MYWWGCLTGVGAVVMCWLCADHVLVCADHVLVCAGHECNRAESSVGTSLQYVCQQTKTSNHLCLELSKVFHRIRDGISHILTVSLLQISIW